MFLLALLTFLICFSKYTTALCPLEGNITVNSVLKISTNDFQTSHRLTPTRTCLITLNPSSRSSSFIVSVATFLHFAKRQPTKSNEIIIHEQNRSYIVRMDKKSYRLMTAPLTLEIPMNLIFRSRLIFTEVIPCSRDTFQCHNFLCSDANECPPVCLNRYQLCDGIDNCGEEGGCQKLSGYTNKEEVMISAFIYDKNYPSSSQLMLIGFFLLNGFFLAFFLVLSMCSVGYCYSNRIFKYQNRRSRIRFLKYLRDASSTRDPDDIFMTTELIDANRELRNSFSQSSSLSPKADRRHRASILSRINFEPAPTLTELEPESEDRSSITDFKDDICEPPKHRTDVFFRRQSLPVIQITSDVEKKKKPDWKTSSVHN